MEATSKLNAVIDRIAEELPHGYVVNLHIERNSGRITLENRGGWVRDIDLGGGQSIAAHLEHALDTAIEEAKR